LSEALEAYRAALERPRLVQRRLWRKLVPQLARASFWRRRHGVISRLEDFPITEYEADYREVVHQAFERPGQQASPFNGDFIGGWVESTGSLGAPALHPWTQSAFAPMTEAFGLMRVMRIRRFGQYSLANALPLPGTDLVPRGPGAQRVTMLSNLVTVPSWRLDEAAGKPVPHPVALLDTEEDIAHWRPAFALTRDLLTINGTLPASITRLVQNMERDRERLLQVVAGKQHVLGVLSHPAPLTLQRLFPRLRFVGCWKADTAGLQLSALRAVLGEKPEIVDNPLISSEGLFNIPDPGRDLGGPLALGTNIYEFLEPGAQPVPDNLLRPWDLEEGRTYEIVPTTALGYVRYRIGDLVDCLGFQGKTPVVAYAGRARSELSLGLVTVSEHQITRAGDGLPAPWFLAPLGEGLAIYLPSPRTCEPGLFDEALSALHPRFRLGLQTGEVQPTVVRHLDPAHPVWAGRPGPRACGFPSVGTALARWPGARGRRPRRRVRSGRRRPTGGRPGCPRAGLHLPARRHGAARCAARARCRASRSPPAPARRPG
jgi:hypothetical protein